MPLTQKEPDSEKTLRKRVSRNLRCFLSSSWQLPALTAAGQVLGLGSVWCMDYVALNHGLDIPVWLGLPVAIMFVGFLLLGLLLPVWLVIMSIRWCRSHEWRQMAQGWGSSIGAAVVALGVLAGSLMHTLAGAPDNFAKGLNIPAEVGFVHPRNMTFFSNEEYKTVTAPLRAAAPQLPQLTEKGDATAPNLRKLSRETPELLQEYMLRCLYAEAVNPDFTAHVLQSPLLPAQENDPQTHFRSTRLDECCSFNGQTVTRRDSPEGTWSLPLENGWSIMVRKPDFRTDRWELNDYTQDIATLDASLADLARTPTREYLDSILPPLPDKPFVCLWDAGPGIYEMLLIIPGNFGAGNFELRAHEYTSGRKIRFSHRFLPEKTLGNVCRVICSDGWCTVFSGDWNEYYGSTWEIWFTPASGGEARCVNSQNFLMMGWMH